MVKKVQKPGQRTRKTSALEAAAYHKAGHAVAAFILGRAVRQAETGPGRWLGKRK